MYPDRRGSVGRARAGACLRILMEILALMATFVASILLSQPILPVVVAIWIGRALVELTAILLLGPILAAAVLFQMGGALVELVDLD